MDTFCINGLRMKYVAPSVNETAFNCPHCGALAKQFWHSVRADQNDEKSPTPITVTEGDERDLDFKQVEDKELRASLIEWAAEMKKGRPFFEAGKDGRYGFQNVYNLFISQCFNCEDIAVWRSCPPWWCSSTVAMMPGCAPSTAL